MSEPRLFLDADGVVRWSVVNAAGQARDLAGYLSALDTLDAL